MAVKTRGVKSLPSLVSIIGGYHVRIIIQHRCPGYALKTVIAVDRSDKAIEGAGTGLIHIGVSSACR